MTELSCIVRMFSDDRNIIITFLKDIIIIIVERAGLAEVSSVHPVTP